MGDRYKVGTTVVDVDTEDPDPAVVVRKTDMRISHWTVDEENTTTLQEDNPEYDEDELTTLVAYKDYLDEEWPEWQDKDTEKLYQGMMDKGLKWYAYPRSRLIPQSRYMPEEYATLNDEGKEKYGHMFVLDRIPLGHILDQRVKSENPDTDEEVEVTTFAMDYGKLLPEEKEKLKEFLKDKFDEDEEEFQEHLSEMSHTVPIRSKFVTGATSQVPFRYM